MGLDCTIRYPGGSTPQWVQIRDHLAQAGENATIRMIDGLPAFPDEMPVSTWAELRLGINAGMATLRRGEDSLTCVIWANADPGLRVAFHKLIWACAVAGGLIETPSGLLSADQFAQDMSLKFA